MNNFISLTNRAFEVVMSSLTPIENWGIYLLDPAFEHEPELRNKVGTIWICSLLDTMEAEKRFLPEIAKEAKEQGFSSIVHNCEQLQNFCTFVGELLDRLSREEQIYLTDLRNQLVHGYLAGRHRDRINIKYVVSGRLTTEHLDDESYHEIIRSFDTGKSIDEVIAPIVARVLDRNQRYWQAITWIQENKKLIYKTMKRNGTFEIRV